MAKKKSGKKNKDRQVRGVDTTKKKVVKVVDKSALEENKSKQKSKQKNKQTNKNTTKKNTVKRKGRQLTKPLPAKTVKKKNTILKDACILAAITLIAGFLLGFVYDITKEPIAKASDKAKNEAYKKVFEEAESFEPVKSVEDIQNESESYLKEKNFSDVTIDEAMYAVKSGENIGVVLSATAKNGYGGDITISLGVKNDKTVTGMEILTINETAGLGMKATEDEFKKQYANKKVEEFEYTKTGAKEENEIDALSGATITTNAVTNAMNAGISYADNELLGK